MNYNGGQLVVTHIPTGRQVCALNHAVSLSKAKEFLKRLAECGADWEGVRGIATTTESYDRGRGKQSSVLRELYSFVRPVLGAAYSEGLLDGEPPW